MAVYKAVRHETVFFWSDRLDPAAVLDAAKSAFREAANDGGSTIAIDTPVKITNRDEIPDEWRNAFTYGHDLDMRLMDLLPVQDPK